MELGLGFISFFGPNQPKNDNQVPRPLGEDIYIDIKLDIFIGIILEFWLK